MVNEQPWPEVQPRSRFRPLAGQRFCSTVAFAARPREKCSR